MISDKLPKSLLLIGLVCSLVASTVESLKCYQCTSNSEVHCTEKFDKEHADIQPKECDVYGAQYCVKTTGMYKGEVGTQRFCSPVGWGDVCEFVQRKGDFREYRSCVYTCSGNECNSAKSTFQFNQHSLLLVFVICIYLHFNL